MAEDNALHDLEIATNAGGEAQAAAIADDIAYNNHALHDGLRAGLFTVDEISELPIVGPAFAEVDRHYPGLEARRRRHEGLRRVFGVMVEDVLVTSRHLIQELNPASAEELRAAGHPVIRFSPRLWGELKQIRAFLFARMYRAPSVLEMRREVTRVVEELFVLFMAEPGHLPEEWRADVADAEGETALARIVCDYIAGMTDRFALETHKRLIG